MKVKGLSNKTKRERAVVYSVDMNFVVDLVLEPGERLSPEQVTTALVERCKELMFPDYEPISNCDVITRYPL